MKPQIISLFMTRVEFFTSMNHSEFLDMSSVWELDNFCNWTRYTAEVAWKFPGKFLFEIVPVFLNKIEIFGRVSGYSLYLIFLDFIQCCMVAFVPRDIRFLLGWLLWTSPYYYSPFGEIFIKFLIQLFGSSLERRCNCAIFLGYEKVRESIEIC